MTSSKQIPRENLLRGSGFFALAHLVPLVKDDKSVINPLINLPFGDGDLLDDGLLLEVSHPITGPYST